PRPGRSRTGRVASRAPPGRSRGAHRRLRPRAGPGRGARRPGRPHHAGRAPRADPGGPVLRRAPRALSCEQRSRSRPGRPGRGRGGGIVNWARVRTVARTEPKQLIGAKDFWVPMGILGALFFIIVPTVLLV